MDPQSHSQPKPVMYLCGNCGKDVTLKALEKVQCTGCSYPVVFKKRTRRIVEFQAR